MRVITIPFIALNKNADAAENNFINEEDSLNLKSFLKHKHCTNRKGNLGQSCRR